MSTVYRGGGMPIHFGPDPGTEILVPPAREGDTAAWIAFTEDTGGARRPAPASARSRWRARAARTTCALLSIACLIFGFSSLINSGVDVLRHGLELLALVAGGACLAALIFAVTDE